jgi:protein-disulfide isomerase
LRTKSGLKIAVNASDHFQGPGMAPLVLVEYGDYQCDQCGDAYGMIKKIQDDLGEQLKFVFRNLPMTTVHPDALSAALAAEAAALQCKFWPMHDLLFENQKELSDNHFEKLANRLNLDMNLFDAAVKKTKLKKRIEKEVEGAIRSGVNGTPTFFVNGSRYQGDWSFAPLFNYLENILSEERMSY